MDYHPLFKLVLKYHFLIPRYSPIAGCPQTAIKFMTCVSCSERGSDKPAFALNLNKHPLTANVNSGKMFCTGENNMMQN